MKRAACCRPRKRSPSTSTIDIDCRKLQDGRRRPIEKCSLLFYSWWMSTTAFFYWSTFFNVCGYIFYHTIGHKKCRRRQPLHFSWSTLTNLLFSIWSRVNAGRHVHVRQRPFYSPFHHAPTKI